MVKTQHCHLFLCSSLNVWLSNKVTPQSLGIVENRTWNYEPPGQYCTFGNSHQI